MKKFAFGAVLVSLGVFVAGCNDTAKQKDTTQRTVKTNQQTGETTVKEEEKHTGKDTATGAKEDTSVEKETTIKPAQENGKNGAASDTAPSNNKPTTDTEPANP